MNRALSGRRIDQVTAAAVIAGELSQADIRIHPDALSHQAAEAERTGNPQLAANLRRAAELAGLDDDYVLTVYEALRPGRSTREELDRIASELDAHNSPLNAALVREAANVYTRRGLCR